MLVQLIGVCKEAPHEITFYVLQAVIVIWRLTSTFVSGQVYGMVFGSSRALTNIYQTNFARILSTVLQISRLSGPIEL